MALLDQSFCNLFDGRPSPNLPFSRPFHAGRCISRSTAVQLTTSNRLGCAMSIQRPWVGIVGAPIWTGSALNIGHILSAGQRGLHCCLAPVPSAVGGPALFGPINPRCTPKQLNNATQLKRARVRAAYCHSLATCFGICSPRLGADCPWVQSEFKLIHHCPESMNDSAGV